MEDIPAADKLRAAVVEANILDGIVVSLVCANNLAAAIDLPQLDGGIHAAGQQEMRRLGNEANGANAFGVSTPDTSSHVSTSVITSSSAEEYIPCMHQLLRQEALLRSFSELSNDVKLWRETTRGTDLYISNLWSIKPGAALVIVQLLHCTDKM